MQIDSEKNNNVQQQIINQIPNAEDYVQLPHRKDQNQ